MPLIFCRAAKLVANLQVQKRPVASKRKICSFAFTFTVTYPLTARVVDREGRLRTTYDLTTSFLHFSLFSTARWDFAHSRPVHSLMLSSHLSCSCRYLLVQTLGGRLVAAKLLPVFTELKSKGFSSKHTFAATNLCLQHVDKLALCSSSTFPLQISTRGSNH